MVQPHSMTDYFTRSLSDLGGRYEGKTGLSQILSGFEENSRSI